MKLQHAGEETTREIDPATVQAWRDMAIVKWQNNKYLSGREMAKIINGGSAKGNYEKIRKEITDIKPK